MPPPQVRSCDVISTSDVPFAVPIASLTAILHPWVPMAVGFSSTTFYRLELAALSENYLLLYFAIPRCRVNRWGSRWQAEAI